MNMNMSLKFLCAFLWIPVPFLQELNHSGLIPLDSSLILVDSGPFRWIPVPFRGIRWNPVIPAGICGASKSTVTVLPTVQHSCHLTEKQRHLRRIWGRIHYAGFLYARACSIHLHGSGMVSPRSLQWPTMSGEGAVDNTVVYAVVNLLLH